MLGGGGGGGARPPRGGGGGGGGGTLHVRQELSKGTLLAHHAHIPFMTHSLHITTVRIYKIPRSLLPTYMARWPQSSK